MNQYWLSRKFILVCVVVLMIVGATSCASAEKRSDDPSSEAGMDSKPPQAPPLPGASPLPSGVSETAPTSPPQIVLVLGPGMARGFACVGVLKALVRHQIPIAAIIGVEMGAWVGASYVTSKSINQFEWAVFRIKDDVFRERGLSLARLFGPSRSGEKLSKSLRDIFGEQTIASAKVPFFVGAYSTHSGESQLIRDGLVRNAVRASMSVEPFIEPFEWDDVRWTSTAAYRPLPIQEARDLHLGAVVVVDVLGEEIPMQSTDDDDRYWATLNVARTKTQNELDQADLVLRPKVNAISFWNFSKRTVASLAGEREANRMMTTIKSLVGLPAEPETVK